MPFLRVLSYLLLVLALVAGGVAPGFAHEMPEAAEASMQAPCHGMDGELVEAAPEATDHGACCDAGACRCDCLQHTPAGIALLRPLAPAAPVRQLALHATAGHAPARTLPDTRPPIA